MKDSYTVQSEDPFSIQYRRIIAYKDDVKIGRFESIRQICRKLPIDRRSVQRVLHGVRNHHKGYRFIYE